MYYKTKSKTNWPVVITVSVAVFFLVIIISILVASFLKSKQNNNNVTEVLNTAIPNIELSLNTTDPNQEKVLIQVKITTTDSKGLEKIVIPGADEILITEENQTEYLTTFEARINGEYEIQAYGKNGVFGNNKIQVSNIKITTAVEPYIPLDFTKIEGTDVNTGLVIKDKFDNEYVWVPVVGGRLIRNRSETDTKYYENTNEYSQFINSVAKYQGFYIGRYEAGITLSNGKEVAISKADILPSNGVSFSKANKLSNEVAENYQYNGYQTSLVSSSAWDTTLAWINKSVSNYSTGLNNGNYKGTLLKTGESTDKANNIFDLAGNLREWTSEKYRLSEQEKRNIQNTSQLEQISDYNIMRGGSASNSSTANRSTAGNPESTYQHVGFRFVLYKD